MKNRNMIHKHFILPILCLGLLCSCSGKTAEPQEVPDTSNVSSAEDVQKLMQATPSATEQNPESGVSAETYASYTFAGYDGQISYYYSDDSLIYYKWFLLEPDKSKAKEIYSDVCEALTGSYGEGEESNSEATGLYTTSFTNDTQQITAQLQSGDSGYEISYMVTG